MGQQMNGGKHSRSTAHLDVAKISLTSRGAAAGADESPMIHGGVAAQQQNYIGGTSSTNFTKIPANGSNGSEIIVLESYKKSR